MSTGWLGTILRTKECGSGLDSEHKYLCLDGAKNLLTPQKRIAWRGQLRVNGGRMVKTFGTGPHAATI